MNLGTEGGGMVTSVGNRCLFMPGSHVAHDCRIGDNVIMANNATLAGHVVLEDNVIMRGLSGAQQFVRIGRGAIIGAMAGRSDEHTSELQSPMSTSNAVFLLKKKKRQ